MSIKSTRIQILSFVLAVLAFSVSVASGIFTYRNLKVTEQNHVLAVNNEKRLNDQDQIRIAGKVVLGEVPQYVYKIRKKESGRIFNAVINRSQYPVDNVWVEGEDNRSIPMYEIPGCEMYIVPSDFIPTAAYFTDQVGTWKITGPTSVPESSNKKFPKSFTDKGAWDAPVEGC